MPFSIQTKRRVKKPCVLFVIYLSSVIFSNYLFFHCFYFSNCQLFNCLCNLLLTIFRIFCKISFRTSDICLLKAPLELCKQFLPTNQLRSSHIVGIFNPKIKQKHVMLTAITIPLPTILMTSSIW